MKVNMELNDTKEVGQFIPLHYHFQMLYDNARIIGFKNAIRAVVKPTDIVLELGSGTGVLSFYASEKAKKVYSVEFNGELVEESKRLLRLNPNFEKIEVIHADAFEYMPPEPVDVVICEMLHVGLLREKQLAMIEAFKTRYSKRFSGSIMPVFIPTATIQAIQPVFHDFRFEGYYAPLTLFQDPYHEDPRTLSLGNPVVYHQLMYGEDFGLDCNWSGSIQIAQEGTLNALRVITKNILAMNPSDNQIIDWHNQYLIVPLEKELKVKSGQDVKVSFDYKAGAALATFKPIIE